MCSQLTPRTRANAPLISLPRKRIADGGLRLRPNPAACAQAIKQLTVSREQHPHAMRRKASL